MVYPYYFRISDHSFELFTVEIQENSRDSRVCLFQVSPIYVVTKGPSSVGWKITVSLLFLRVLRFRHVRGKTLDLDYKVRLRMVDTNNLRTWDKYSTSYFGWLRFNKYGMVEKTSKIFTVFENFNVCWVLCWVCRLLFFCLFIYII